VKLTVIAGPTASGKTALAIEVALRRGAEIVSADSQQVYRYFDIGTAKPSAAELARVRHHLISCVDPLESDFSAARYCQLADAAIADITARGKDVVVVGGTGMYLRMLLYGVMQAPARDDALRQRLEAFANVEGNAALHARLAAVDSATAAKYPVADRLRVIRALEIFELTGKPASEHREEHAFSQTRYSASIWVLNPDRERLYPIINSRTQGMFDAGLVDEVKHLIDAGFRHAAPMRAVGYHQALAVVDGTMTLQEAVVDAAQKTRHYAKRQLTWFRKEKGARFLPSTQDALNAIVNDA
jgi:tRNA dimethylallyltransferase